MKIVRCLCIVLLVLIPSISPIALADPPGPPGPGGNPTQGGGAPVGAPVDNGVLVLLILGASYGFYKLYKHQLSRQE